MRRLTQIKPAVGARANAERCISPVILAPSLIVHHKNVTFDAAPIIYTQGFAFNQMGWVM